MKTQITPEVIKALNALCKDISLMHEPKDEELRSLFERIEKAIPYILRLRTEMVYYRYKVNILEAMQHSVFMHLKAKYKTEISDSQTHEYFGYLAQRNYELNYQAEHLISGL